MKKFLKPALLLAAIAIMAFGMLSSGAWFSDTATSQVGTLQSGSLSIDDGKVAQMQLGTIQNMAPGDVTDPVSIVIQNNGSISLGWFGDLIVSDSVLKDAIYIRNAKMEFLQSDGITQWSTATVPDEFIKDGVYAYESGAPLAGADHLVSLAEWDGNNGMGVTPYEFMGYLEPGYMYKLTLQFGFMENAGNEYQNKEVQLSFKADATQVKLGALQAKGVGNALDWLNRSNCQYDGLNITPATGISTYCH